MSVFSRLGREAKAWAAAPADDALARIVALARDASAEVPEARRADWDRLLGGFGQGDPGKTRARVEGLVRACRLFEREARRLARLATPLAWTDAVERVDGVGPAARNELAARGVVTVGDLAWTLPVGWDDLRAPVTVAEAAARGRAASEDLEPPPRLVVAGVVRSVSVLSMRGRRGVRVVLGGEGPGDALDAWWFYVAQGVLATAKKGTPCLFVGRVRAPSGKRASMAHPDVILDEPGRRGVRARYMAMGVAPGMLRRSVADALARTPELPDPVPAVIVAREGMAPAEPLLRSVHGHHESEPAEARRALGDRLAWVEAFTRVWQRRLAESSWGGARAPVLPEDAGAVERLATALGFELTAGQQRAIAAIARDLASPTPMRRLLLGDVGTGKTAVALAGAAQCIAAGYQCALLVPTGVLADQYLDAAAPLARASGARIERVVAGMRAAERREALSASASGAAHLVVGTHALLEEGVDFARLGLVVVDEQQRLGVAQRLRLVQKGAGASALRPHLLSLSATPIPRTLALALRGELATSRLDERPRGRPPVATALVPRAGLAGVTAGMAAACARGERVFYVSPRIDDDEEAEEPGALSHAERLARDLAPARVAVVHGAMAPAERVRAMRAFRSGEVQVLVGTTVVEVGVDVPEATLMVIDGAERFGLAQLHQLRGRVGRGDRPGRCVLVHDEPLGEVARRRLETLVRTTDGAEVARADLELRGAGDLGGTRQHGAEVDFVWIDAMAPPAWIDRVDADARALLEADPKLEAPGHQALAHAVRRFAVSLAVREEAG